MQGFRIMQLSPEFVQPVQQQWVTCRKSEELTDVVMMRGTTESDHHVPWVHVRISVGTKSWPRRKIVDCIGILLCLDGRVANYFIDTAPCEQRAYEIHDAKEDGFGFVTSSKALQCRPWCPGPPECVAGVGGKPARIG